MRRLTLYDDIAIPIMGFGTWKLQGPVCSEAVRAALEIGYRHIDTAILYGNHRDVATGIEHSGVQREDVWLTSKLPPDSLGADEVHVQTQIILEELATDYIDLLLIHWPNHEIEIAETLSAMDDLRSQGRVKALGVSNFTIHHLEEAKKTGIPFYVNQVEYHPSLNQQELLQYCHREGITVTGYSPVAQGKDLDLAPVVELAEKYGRSPAQVVLNWLMSKDIVVIPRSDNPDHIRDNYAALEWELDAQDRELLEVLDSGNRLVAPSHAEFDY